MLVRVLIDPHASHVIEFVKQTQILNAEAENNRYVPSFYNLLNECGLF